MATLFDRRFVVLSGKGGVGRTTMAAALARAAVRAGKRVLLAQMDSPARLARLLGHPSTIGPEVTPISDGLDAVNMTARESIHQYVVMALRYESIYRALFDNKAVQGFLGAVPGLDAYAMLGKTWWHTTEVVHGRARYDIVILDAPASGHTVTVLKIPNAILEAMPKGPLARDAAEMHSLFRDPARASLVIVTLPEELPARETVELARAVRAMPMPLGPLIVNGMPPPEPSRPALRAVLDAIAGESTGDPALDATLVGASVLAARRREAERVLADLRLDPALPIIQLPRLPTTDLGPAEVDELADALYDSVTSS